MYDVYVSDRDSVRVVDFNPVGGATATLLFDSWADLGYCLLPPAGDADDADATEAAAVRLERVRVSPDDASCGWGSPAVAGPTCATSAADATDLQSGGVNGRGDAQQNGHAALPKPPEVRRNCLYTSTCHSASRQPHITSPCILPDAPALRHVSCEECQAFNAALRLVAFVHPRAGLHAAFSASSNDAYPLNGYNSPLQGAAAGSAALLRREHCCAGSRGAWKQSCMPFEVIQSQG